jgi:invasion protein IalB
MLQAAISKQTKQRVISVSLAYVPSQDTYAAQIVVPLGVALARGLTIAAGAQKIEGVKFRRCEHDGCYVEAVLNKNSIEGFSSVGNAATINVFPYRRSQVVGLPMSLNGFGQALTKLKELARQKAVTPPPTATPPATPAPATH